MIGTRFPGFESMPPGAKAGLIIVHGIAEHGARYRHAADALANMIDMGDAPSCHVCGSIMVRNGSCYKCMSCGSTSGCS